MTRSNVIDKKPKYKVTIGCPMPLGTNKIVGGINFAVIVHEECISCSLILYKKGTDEVFTEIPFTEEMRFGNVFAMCLIGLTQSEFDYNYRIDNKTISDPYGVLINGAGEFGSVSAIKKTTSFYVDNFNWENDSKLNIPFSDSLIYRLHVRGFTMGKYSKVRKKGTFAGILEKIDYLKSLGVTMVELMPAYEFNEVIEPEKFCKYEPRVNNIVMPEDIVKIDFWGYRDGDYFMPKVSYSYKKDPVSAIKEFKTMVKELHKNNIEVSMEFHFKEDVTPAYMIDCFRHWVLNYHIDGIHCNMSEDIRGAVSSDPYLARTKIISYGFSGDNYSTFKHLGEFNNVFMNTARRFLKGDEGQVSDMAFRIKYNKAFAAPINFMANNDSFTMMDMVSYDIKHNELNGENNKDGTDYNYSWNCGHEGETKRKSVVALRRQQLKNAMAFIMLSQGTPLIYAGDEFGNSCNGNNNPYCQDNEISYLDWRLVNKNSWLLNFTRQLIEFRKDHKILHLTKPLEGRDYRSLGMPDVSFHCEKTWSLDNDILSRTFGMMLNGKYCKLFGGEPEENLYIAFNMNWLQVRQGVPTPGKGKKWKFMFSTNELISEDDLGINSQRFIDIPPRSIVVLEGIDGMRGKNEQLLIKI